MNHRKLLKQHYYKGEFHRMLGIKFKGPPPQRPPLSRPRERDPSPRPLKSESIPRKAVNTGLEEREIIEVSSDSEGEIWDKSYKRPKEEIKSEDEEGRYDVGNPARKRRRLGRDVDKHTIYVSDDEYHTMSISEEEGSLKAGRRETSRRNDKKPSSRSFEQEERRRAYWASKGGLGLPDDAD